MVPCDIHWLIRILQHVIKRSHPLLELSFHVYIWCTILWNNLELDEFLYVVHCEVKDHHLRWFSSLTDHFVFWNIFELIKLGLIAILAKLLANLSYLPCGLWAHEDFALFANFVVTNIVDLAKDLDCYVLFFTLQTVEESLNQLPKVIGREIDGVISNILKLTLLVFNYRCCLFHLFI